jgi:hypothetical protein
LPGQPTKPTLTPALEIGQPTQPPDTLAAVRPLGPCKPEVFASFVTGRIAPPSEGTNVPQPSAAMMITNATSTLGTPTQFLRDNAGLAATQRTRSTAPDQLKAATGGTEQTERSENDRDRDDATAQATRQELGSTVGSNLNVKA